MVIKTIECDNIVGEMESMYMMMHLQNRLLTIIHAVNCSTEGVSDCDLDCCQEMRSMLMHAGTCRTKCCSVSGCTEVTFLLGHWTTCSDFSCYLCRRVWGPKKDAEYETKCRDFNRVTAVAAAILDMSNIEPSVASPVIQELVIDTFDEIEYSDYACEVDKPFFQFDQVSNIYYSLKK